ncbi:MAG: hypothetical protein ACK40G_11980 [Cytophagaceae bacterium]
MHDKLEPLSSDDRKIIIGELIQNVISYVLILIIITVTYVASRIFLKETKLNFINNNFTKTHLDILFIFIIIIFAWIKFKSVRYLVSGKKIIFTGVISEKIIQTNFALQGNIPANLVTSPKLSEYYLHIDGVSYFIPKEIYYKFEIGEKVKLSYTTDKKTLLKIEQAP